MSSYLSPNVILGNSAVSGKGLFAVKDLKKGEVIVDYTHGLGEYVDGKRADELYRGGIDHMIQVEDDLYFAATKEEDLEDGDFVNHSCDPNCGIKGNLQIVTMRDVKRGEEIMIDYAMMEASDYSLTCRCGSQHCRGTITGDDWMMPELQKRYRGYFSDYLEKKIVPAIERPVPVQ